MSNFVDALEKQQAEVKAKVSEQVEYVEIRPTLGIPKSLFPSLTPDEQALAGVIDHCREILVAKARYYAGQQGRFHNFKVAPIVTAGVLSPIQYAWTLPQKHMTAAMDLIFSKSAEEYQARGGDAALREYLGDMANYCLLILAMLERGVAVLPSSPFFTQNTHATTKQV